MIASSVAFLHDYHETGSSVTLCAFCTFYPYSPACWAWLQRCLLISRIVTYRFVDWMCFLACFFYLDMNKHCNSHSFP